MNRDLSNKAIIKPSGNYPAPAEIERIYPNFMEGFRKAAAIVRKIRSFEDIELHLLKGQGLSPNTYRSYMVSIRQLYRLTGGLSPFQIRPSHIEAFYDMILTDHDETDENGRKKHYPAVDRNTAYGKIRGLKRFFKGIQELVPGWASPFDIMSEKLIKKLNRSRKKGGTKAALRKNEAAAVLKALRDHREDSVLAALNYATIFMMLTSGLRASELCGLKWKDLDFDSDLGSWVARFIGKGDKPAEQQLYGPAVDACREYFVTAYDRIPEGEDWLFYTEPIKGYPIRPLKAHDLWYRVRKVYRWLRLTGVLTREIQFSPHLFRRTFATLLYKSGMKLKALMEQTRHSSVEILSKHYIDDRESTEPYFNQLYGEGGDDS